MSDVTKKIMSKYYYAAKLLANEVHEKRRYTYLARTLTTSEVPGHCFNETLFIELF
jgi:hypothetical protein